MCHAALRDTMTDSQCKFQTRLPALRSAEQVRADDLSWRARQVLSRCTTCRSEHGKQSGDGEELGQHAARTCLGDVLRTSWKSPLRRGRTGNTL